MSKRTTSTRELEQAAKNSARKIAENAKILGGFTKKELDKHFKSR